MNSSKDMLQWQYKTLLAELQQLELHASGDCPCILNELDPPERCVGKHTLNVFSLASETAQMDNPNKTMLLKLSEAAEERHDQFKEFICHKGPLPELAAWARKWRKELEPIYYLCGVKRPHAAHVADPGAVAEKVAAQTHWPTDREKVVAVYTGPRDKVLAVRTVAQGDKHTAPLPVPHIVRDAQAHGAQGITILHNHPSGTTEISAEDRQATDMLKTAAHHAGIREVHHIVVGHGATARVAEKAVQSRPGKLEHGMIAIRFKLGNLQPKGIKWVDIMGFIDTGSTLTTIPESTAKELGMSVFAHQRVQTALGETSYPVASAWIDIGGHITISPVWITQSAPKIGLVTLESLRLKVNPVTGAWETALRRATPEAVLMEDTGTKKVGDKRYRVVGDSIREGIVVAGPGSELGVDWGDGPNYFVPGFATRAEAEAEVESKRRILQIQREEKEKRVKADIDLVRLTIEASPKSDFARKMEVALHRYGSLTSAQRDVLKRIVSKVKYVVPETGAIRTVRREGEKVVEFYQRGVGWVSETQYHEFVDSADAGFPIAEPAKQPWEMTLTQRLEEVENIRHRHGLVQAHERAVRQALSEGKPVPPEVLADYPDLAAKAKMVATCPLVGKQARLFQPSLSKYIDKCNLSPENEKRVWAFRPLRDFILWSSTISKTQICQAGLVPGAIQLTIHVPSIIINSEITNRALRIPGLKEIGVFGSSERVFTVVLPFGEVAASELLGGKQVVVDRPFVEAAPQGRLFEPLPEEPKWSSFGSKERQKYYDPNMLSQSPKGIDAWNYDTYQWEHFLTKDEYEDAAERFVLTKPAAEEKKWYRYGLPPQSNASWNYMENKSERGVSVYATPKGSSPFFAGRPVYTGPGRQVGWGSDGEPLIIPSGVWKRFRPLSIKGHIAQLDEPRRPSRCVVVHRHGDGDQTLKCKGGLYVKTTDGKMFAQVKDPGIALSPCEKAHHLGGKLERCVVKVKAKTIFKI